MKKNTDFVICSQCRRKMPKKRVRRRMVVISLCLILLLLCIYGVQYIPKSYEDELGGEPLSRAPGVAYAASYHWVYYVNDFGWMCRERVKFEPRVSTTLFDVWKYLNGVGDDVEIIDTVSMDTRYDREKYGEVAEIMYGHVASIVVITFSKSIQKYENYEKLLDSYRKTLLQFNDGVQILLD